MESDGEQHGSPRDSGGVSRRQLLIALGAAGGAGLVIGALGAMELGDDESTAPFTPPSGSDFSLQGRANDVDVIVVGAGIAGLCCAYELGKAEYRVTVIDARTRIGGRCWTVRGGDRLVDTRREEQQCGFADGRWMNAGPGRIAQHHTTMNYCRELGVPIEVFLNVNTDAYVSADGVVRRRRSVQADLDGYVSELLLKAIGQDALDDHVTDSEMTLLVDHLRDVGALGRADRGYERPPGVGDDVGVIAPPDDLEILLRLGFGQRLLFEQNVDQVAPMFHPVGGMDRIAAALAAASGATMRLGRAVRTLRTTADGVEVVTTDDAGRDERFTATYGVCAIPPHLTAAIDTDFDAAVLTALAEPQPVATGKIGLEYDDRFWETQDRIFGGITHADPSVRDIWYPSTGYLGEGGVIIGAYPFGPDADRFGRLPHAERLELALTVGEGIHGTVYRDALRSAVSVDWRTQEHSRGAWSGWRRFGVAYNRLLQGEGHWWFAGDWLARTPGWQHGAFESARRSVTDLHRAALNT